MNLTELSDTDLLSHLQALASQARVTLARLLATLGEVEERRLHLEAACSSLFDFCIQRLGMSEGEAFRRITAARIARRFPAVLECIERGELHLSSVVLLRDYLTVENHAQLLREASGKSKRGVQELIAAHFPRPDAPPRIRTLPPTAASIEPLSVSRYKVQFTASAELRRKIDRAADLMRHRNPTGDLAIVMERALDLLIAQLEKERLGKTKRPASHAVARTSSSGHVTKATRREVFERDGERCSFVDAEGRRCSSTAFLELDHAQPRAMGGTNEAANLRVLCRAHNRRMAERAFGRDHVEKQIHLRRRKCGDRVTTKTAAKSCDVTSAPVDVVLREGVAALIAKARASSIPRGSGQDASAAPSKAPEAPRSSGSIGH